MDVGRAPDVWLFFARCTMEARRAISHARQAVMDHGGPLISPEHLLYGLLEPDVLASRHLAAPSDSAAGLQRQLVAGFAGSEVPPNPDVALSPEAKLVLNNAWAEAEALGHLNICSDHMLLGLLATDTLAARLMTANEVAAAAVRGAIPERDPDEDDG